MVTDRRDIYVEEGVDALALLTPLIERRRQILAGVLLFSALVAVWSLVQPRRYRAEMALAPVMGHRTMPALGGLAALAGATLQTGYQLTPARMVELLTSRAVLSGVGFSPLTAGSRERVIDRALGERYELNDAEHVAKLLSRYVSVDASPETGTISVSVTHRDSALARLIVTRIVDSASQKFVRISKAQAQQLRMAQETRVVTAASQLAAAENRLREFNFGNRAAPSFSVAGLERDRLDREIRFAEQVYTQAVTERDAAFARELEATPTVVVQDPLPANLPRVRKRTVMKTIVAAVVSFVALSLYVLLSDMMRRRMQKRDPQSERFRNAVATLPRLRQRAREAV